MPYSYQDCWNYTFSQEKINDREQIKNDLITICQISPEEFWFNFSKKLLTESNYQKICQKIDKHLREDYPVPYLVEKVNFYQLSFQVKPGVFIPQKDSEILVEKLLELTNNWKKRKLRVLEIGTGCGNLVITLAKIKPEWDFIATDINQKALEVATNNALIHQTKNIKFIHSDLFTNLNFFVKFDVIISNPPYVSKNEYMELSPMTKRQPREALMAGEDGNFFYQEILRQSQQFLDQKFLLLLEISPLREERIIKLVIKCFPENELSVFPDWGGNSRLIAIY